MARAGTAPRRALKTCKRTLVYPICRSSTTGRFRKKTRGVKCFSELRTLCRSRSAGTFTSPPVRGRNRAEGSRGDQQLVVYDNAALKLMERWWGGQNDPLYAIVSRGGLATRDTIKDALGNVEHDLSRVKRLPRRAGRGDHYQLGKGTFTRAEIDELRIVRDALRDTLNDPDAVYNETRGRMRRPLRRR